MIDQLDGDRQADLDPGRLRMPLRVADPQVTAVRPPGIHQLQLPGNHVAKLGDAPALAERRHSEGQPGRSAVTGAGAGPPRQFDIEPLLTDQTREEAQQHREQPWESVPAPLCASLPMLPGGRQGAREWAWSRILWPSSISNGRIPCASRVDKPDIPVPFRQARGQITVGQIERID